MTAEGRIYRGERLGTEVVDSLASEVGDSLASEVVDSLASEEVVSQASEVEESLPTEQVDSPMIEVGTQDRVGASREMRGGLVLADFREMSLQRTG